MESGTRTSWLRFVVPRPLHKLLCLQTTIGARINGLAIFCFDCPSCSSLRQQMISLDGVWGRTLRQIKSWRITSLVFQGPSGYRTDKLHSIQMPKDKIRLKVEIGWVNSSFNYGFLREELIWFILRLSTIISALISIISHVRRHGIFWKWKRDRWLGCPWMSWQIPLCIHKISCRHVWNFDVDTTHDTF